MRIFHDCLGCPPLAETALATIPKDAMSNPMRIQREQLIVSQNLTAAPAAVWRLLAAGTRVERWFPWVATTIVDDASEGGRRRIELTDGRTFDEYIVLNDPRSMTYQYYAPAPPLPIQHVIGTHRIEPLPGGGARLSWHVTFDVLPTAPTDIVATMRELYRAALMRLDTAAQHVAGA